MIERFEWQQCDSRQRLSTITDARRIIAFRNILVHGYDIIRNEVVWGILESDLLTLTRQFDTLLEQGEAEQTPAEDT